MGGAWIWFYKIKCQKPNRQNLTFTMGYNRNVTNMSIQTGYTVLCIRDMIREGPKTYHEGNPRAS